MEKDDPRIKEWRDGIPFDANGEIIRGVRLSDEEKAQIAEMLKELDDDPDNDVNERPWMRHCWWK